MADPLDAQDDEHRERTRTQKKLARDTEAADIRWLMGSKRGRRIIRRLLEHAGVFRLSFNAESLQMAFAEGRRNEGLRLLNMIHAHCADKYPVMLQEREDDYECRERSR